MWRTLPKLLVLVVLLSSCAVRRDMHQAALDAVAEGQDRIAATEQERDACAEARELVERELDESQRELDQAQSSRDAVLADNTALRAQLSETGADVDALVAERSTLSEMLEESARALEEARARQQAAEARDAIFRQLKERLQEMIDAGKLAVRIARGRMVIDLKQDILFPSGRARLSVLGEETLASVATALADFPDRRFQVEGHTDNVPIKTDRFPSNWNLSTARAVSVVSLLVDRGMAPENLSAAGYGEFEPRADNGSEEGRTLNRRIEIVMVPDLQILPDLVDSL